MWIAVLILSGIATVTSTLRHMHMFQLNSYRAKTHLAWLSQHRSAWILQVVIVFFAFLTVFLETAAGIIVLLILVVAILSSLPRKRQAKKPLVYTSRVIRMLVTISVLVGLIIAAVILTHMSLGPWGTAVGVLPYVLTVVWVILANWINTPIEYGVRTRYLNDAKRMLAGHPRLIKIGITGSYGKTSLKYYLATLLRGRFNVLMTPESYNTPMGITKAVRSQLRATHEVFVCEMGAERVGEIKQDCDLVVPTIGVITAIGEQHLVTFGSQEAILATKLELADAVRGKGMLYLNGDDPLLETHQPDQQRSLYGLGEGNGTVAQDIDVSMTGTRFTLTHRGTRYTDLVTPLIGRHTIQNLCGAIAVGLDLGLSESELRTGLKKLQPAPHRLAMSRLGDVTIIDDAYNSNPAGAKAALDTLAMFDGMKILITPGMVQLGPRQDVLNEEFGAQAVICDHVFLVGPKQTEPIARGLAGAGYDPKKLTVVTDVKQAIAQAQALPATGQKVILLENDLPDNY